MVFCANCGTAVASAFCTNCGEATAAPREDEHTEIVPGEVVTSEVAPVTMSMPLAPPAAPPSPPPMAGPAPVTGGSSFPTGLFLKSLAAFSLVAALVVGGLFGYQWWRDRPVTEALSASDEAMGRVTGLLDSAESLEDLGTAGAAAPKARAEVEKALEGLDESDERSRAATNVLKSQAALLEAIAPMQELDSDSLAVWGETLPGIREAETTLVGHRDALLSTDSGLAEVVRDPSASTDHAAAVVATSAASTLTSQLESTLDSMAEVSNTSGAAALGKRAGSMQASAEAALVGQAAGTDSATLTDLAAAFEAIGGLSEMAPDSLDVWDDLEGDLEEATSDLGVDSSAALSSMANWVTEARQAIADWEVAHAEAMSLRSAATQELDSYSGDMERILRDYDQARHETADTLEEAESEEYGSYEVESLMEQGVTVRQGLLDEITYLTPPDGMGTTHEKLVGLIESGLDAMIVGEQAVEDWNACWYECDDSYADAEGWEHFLTESQKITEEFDASRNAWDQALVAALRDADVIPLPAMPEV